MAIIQGTNKPITILLDDDISNADDIVVSISSRNPSKCMKHWHKDDLIFGTIDIDDKEYYTITCRCDQKDTLEFSIGEVLVDLKYSIDGEILFMGTIIDTVTRRACKESLNERSENNE